MMIAPFVRILPLYATVLLVGLAFGNFDVGLLWWSFAGLKIVADVVMHVRDERAIQQALVEKRAG